MRVIISEAAWSDLYRIGATIAQDSRNRAASFTEELYDRCHELHHMAYLYPILPHKPESEIRRRVYGNYLIFYRVEHDTVQILHILHGAMDYEVVLFPDD
jgi:toxin ParE1/3/4